MKKTIILIVCIVFFGCSQNTKKDSSGTPMKDVIRQEKTKTQDNGTAGGRPMLKTVKATDLLPEVAKAYKGIVISVADNKTKKEMEVIFNTDVKVEGTPLTLNVQSLFPDFTIAEGGVANKSMSEKNPGAKVVIKKGKEVVFDGWLFQNFPDTHGFEDPEFKVFMVKTVPTK